jgi:hypothetical protein
VVGYKSSGFKIDKSSILSLNDERCIKMSGMFTFCALETDAIISTISRDSIPGTIICKDTISPCQIFKDSIPCNKKAPDCSGALLEY